MYSPSTGGGGRGLVHALLAHGHRELLPRKGGVNICTTRHPQASGAKEEDPRIGLWEDSGGKYESTEVLDGL